MRESTVVPIDGFILHVFNFNPAWFCLKRTVIALPQPSPLTKLEDSVFYDRPAWVLFGRIAGHPTYIFIRFIHGDGGGYYYFNARGVPIFLVFCFHPAWFL